MVQNPAPAASKELMQRIKKEIHHQLVSRLNLASVSVLQDFELRRQLRRGVEELLKQGRDLLSKEQREQIVDEVIDETLGLGPIEPLLNDPTISDILINGPHAVYVERFGKLEETSVRFHDDDHLLEIVQRVANRVGRRLDEASPIVDARLADGSRVNAVIRPLALDGALVSIRRFPQRPLDVADLLRQETATSEMICFLGDCVAAGLNVLIAGGTGSGKTTLLNVLSSFIPPDQRIATIEDAAELKLQQPHIARMETRPANLEGKGAVTARDLIKNALRMRPDRIVVGECRGGEAFDMLQAMTTGHEGSLATIHANNSRDALVRLEMLVGMADFDLPIWFIQRQIAAAIHIVVHCDRLKGGSRKILQISELIGLDKNTYLMHDLFRFEQTGLDASKQRVRGHFRATGIIPQCLDKLSQAGRSVPVQLFESRVLTGHSQGKGPQPLGAQSTPAPALREAPRGHANSHDQPSSIAGQNSLADLFRRLPERATPPELQNADVVLRGDNAAQRFR